MYILKQMSPLVAMAAACNEPQVRVCADPKRREEDSRTQRIRLPFILETIVLI
jgi:hypothetical protein